MLDAEKEFTTLMEKLCLMEGLDSLLSKIIALAFISPEEISMDEIAEKTGYSLASISLKANMLAQLGIISKTGKPHSRKQYLYMEKDVMKMALAHVKKDLTQTEIIKSELPAIIEKFEKQAKKEEDQKKLKIIKKYYNQSTKIQSVLIKIISECGCA